MIDSDGGLIGQEPFEVGTTLRDQMTISLSSFSNEHLPFSGVLHPRNFSIIGKQRRKWGTIMIQVLGLKSNLILVGMYQITKTEIITL